MSDIPTWHERAMAHPDHQSGMISEEMIRARMGEEIADLRATVERLRDANRQLVAGIDTITRRNKADTDHLCTENARLRARVEEYFREAETHPVEDV